MTIRRRLLMQHLPPILKARVAIEALQEKEPLQALAKKYGISPTVISNWKEELLQNSSKAFDTDASDKRELRKLKQQPLLPA